MLKFKPRFSHTMYHNNPFIQFERWFTDVLKLKDIEPNSMILGTVKDNQPSSRTVLLKDFNERGFVFFTNYGSRKSQEILKNANVSLLFPWYALERQVIILGSAEKISREESLSYFQSRPRNSQLSAWVSDQSKIINSRMELENKLRQTKNDFEGKEVTIPSFWGGFRVIPIEFELRNTSFFQDEIPACQATYKSGTILTISPLNLIK